MPPPDPPAVPPSPLLRVFLPFACGYYISYVFRTVNAVISPDLVRDFALDAAHLGLLTSAYFLTFALAQLPLGMLLDRFGPRRVNGALLAIAGVGALAFAFSREFGGVVLGRALIGLGVSGALMSSIKAFMLWFPLARLATMNGLLMAVGGLGAMSSAYPVHAALGFTDWRGVFELLAAFTFLAAGAILVIVPEQRATASGEPFRALAAGVGTIFRDGVFWRIGIVCMTVQATFMAVQGLWVAPWLRDVAGLDRNAIATYLVLMAIAMTGGFAVFGNVADRLAHRGFDALWLFRVGTVGAAASLAVVAAGVTGAALPAWLAFSFCSTAAALSYSILSKRFAAALSGRVNTSINLLVFVGAFVTQWGMGIIIDQWPAADGHYPEAAYRAAFGAFVALQVLALLPVTFLRLPKPSAGAIIGP